MANHTSPIDVIILASDGCYAMVVWCLCWWFRFSVDIECDICINSVSLCGSGGSGPWWSDGGHSEGDGEGLSSHLVWEVWSEGPTPSGQTVTLHFPHICSIQLQDELAVMIWTFLFVTIKLILFFRLSDHVADTSKLPILIFPEGEC